MKIKFLTAAMILASFGLVLVNVGHVQAQQSSAQDKLPEYGDISDLKGMTKVYVATETTQVRKYVLDSLKKDKALTVVPAVEDADFVLECVQKGSIGNFHMGSVATEMPTFEMTAYIIRNGRHRIAWSKTKNSVRYPPTLLTGDFLSALKKDQK